MDNSGVLSCTASNAGVGFARIVVDRKRSSESESSALPAASRSPCSSTVVLRKLTVGESVFDDFRA